MYYVIILIEKCTKYKYICICFYLMDKDILSVISMWQSRVPIQSIQSIQYKYSYLSIISYKTRSVQLYTYKTHETSCSYTVSPFNKNNHENQTICKHVHTHSLLYTSQCIQGVPFELISLLEWISGKNQQHDLEERLSVLILSTSPLNHSFYSIVWFYQTITGYILASTVLYDFLINHLISASTFSMILNLFTHSGLLIFTVNTNTPFWNKYITNR